MGKLITLEQIENKIDLVDKYINESDSDIVIELLNEKKLSLIKMLDYNWRLRELKFRCASANTLAGFTKYEVINDKISLTNQ